MSDRTREVPTGAGRARRAPKRASRPCLELMEGRALLASLAAIADVTAPVTLGYQVPLNGQGEGPQTFTVTSDNPSIGATVARGKFLTVGVSHASSGATDPAFTGTLTFQLFDDLTPLTTSRIEQLVNEGFYTSPTTGSPVLTSKNFHRIAANFPGANDFIVQGGSQTGNGTGSLTQPGFPFADEFNQQLAFTGNGQLAMANAGDDTNDSQFFITTGSPRFLDFQHTIFGQLVEGQSTLQQMTAVAKGADGTTPVTPILFTSTTLSDTSPDGVIHLDLTKAAAGQTARVTVTATDATGGTATQTFTVNAAANNNSTGQPIVERPFLSPVQNQVVGLNQPAIFQIQGVAPTPGDVLTYGVGGGAAAATATNAFTSVQNATASVDANGVVTVTPNAGFTGVINLLVGVRDQTNRAGTTSIENIGNYDTQKITLTVTNGAVVNLAPIAIPGSSTVPTGQPSTVQLAGNTANPGSPGQTLQYTIVTGPTHGTISNFNASAGTFTYTPTADFLGTDNVSFQVQDVGAPTPNLSSNTAVHTINVGGQNTGAVRLIGNVLVITPPPKATLADKSTNTVLVNQSNGVIQVRVNGQIDNTMPTAANLDRIVVYGTRNSDTITVGQEVLVPTTLDGGHGGVNRLTAGGASSTQLGWFKNFNILKGSPQKDNLTGRAGVVKFIKSGGGDLIYAGTATLGRRHHTPLLAGKQFNVHPGAPHGTFYRFVGKRLVPVKKI